MRVESIKWKTTNTKSTCFHCIDSNVLSGSKWWIHVWSSVTKWQQNFSLSLVGLYKSRRSWHEATHWCRLCTLRFWGTQRDDTVDIWRCYWTMFSILPAKTCNSSAISDTFTFWFVIMQFFCSSNWYWIHCIWKPTRPEVIFQRLMATCEFFELSCCSTVIKHRVTIHGDQTLADFCRLHPSFDKNFISAQYSNFMLSISHAQSMQLCHDDVITTNDAIILSVYIT